MPTNAQALEMTLGNSMLPFLQFPLLASQASTLGLPVYPAQLITKSALMMTAFQPTSEYHNNSIFPMNFKKVNFLFTNSFTKLALHPVAPINAIILNN